MRKYLGFDKDFNLKKTEIPVEKKPKANNFLLAKYANIGYYLVTPVIFGVFLGLFLKGLTRFDGFVFLGIIFGAIGTFYNLFKLTKQ